MIALAASILVALYLLIPSSLFRLLFGLYVPLRNFERTRSEEILQGLLSTVLPIGFASAIVYSVPTFSRMSGSADYEVVFGALYSEVIFARCPSAFWQALSRVSTQEGFLLLFYYLLIGTEGLGMGKLSISYPKFDAMEKDIWIAKRYKQLAKHVLLPSISEWHLLLTPFFFIDKKNTVVRAEILSSEGILYRGKVVEHSSDKNGRLVGIIISHAFRFRRDDYVEDKKNGSVDSKDYWRLIPGSQLYIMAEKIQNLNLSYDGPGGVAASVIEKIISMQLKQAISISWKDKPVLTDPEVE